MADEIQQGQEDGAQPVGKVVGATTTVTAGNAEETGPNAPAPSPAPEDKGEAPKPPEGYDTWDAFKEAVDKGEYKAPDAKTQEVPALDDPRLVPYTDEYTKSGVLSPASVTKAAKEFNVSEDMVRTYVKGIAADATDVTSTITTLAGGHEQYASFQAWANDNLDDKAKEAYNAAMDKGDQPGMQTAIDAWKAAGGGQPPKDLTKGAGSTGGSTGAGPEAGDQFDNWAQVTEAMNDPRYTGFGRRKDPRYIQDVQDKLGRSNL